MKKTKNFFRAAAAFGMAFVLAACSGTVESERPGEGKWRNSDITGSVSENETVRLQDDFAAAANKEFIVNAKSGDSSFSRNFMNLLEKEKTLINSLSYDGEEGELKKYVELAADWDARNKNGAEPLRKYIEVIENISSLDELTAYQCSEEDDPFALGLIMPVRFSQDSSSTRDFCLEIGMPDLSLEKTDDYFTLSPQGYEKKKYICGFTEYVLGRLGYDDRRIQTILNRSFRFERKLAACDNKITRYDQNNDTMIFDYDSCIEKAGNYPLKEIFEARGIPKDVRLCMNTHSIKKLLPLYSEKNLEDIKAMLIVHTVMKGGHFLDREAYDKEMEMQVSKLAETDETQADFFGDDIEGRILYGDYIAQSECRFILDKLYVEKNIDKSTVEDVEKLTDDIINEFRVLFDDEEWLSDEGRKACLEKLDNIQPHVIVPDFDLFDFSGLNITSAKDGGTFFDAQLDSERYGKKLIYKLCSQPYDRSKWYPTGMSTTEINALYIPAENAIYIMAGVAEAPIYSPDMSYEQKLAGLGTIIGHEITHAFDSTGARYDKNGAENKWLPMMDELQFSDRATKVSEYYSTIRPFPNGSDYEGTQVSGEATADMGGLKVTLSIASDSMQSFGVIRCRRTEDVNYLKQIRIRSVICA